MQPNILYSFHYHYQFQKRKNPQFRNQEFFTALALEKQNYLFLAFLAFLATFLTAFLATFFFFATIVGINKDIKNQALDYYTIIFEM